MMRPKDDIMLDVANVDADQLRTVLWLVLNERDEAVARAETAERLLSDLTGYLKSALDVLEEAA